MNETVTKMLQSIQTRLHMLNADTVEARQRTVTLAMQEIQLLVDYYENELKGREANQEPDTNREIGKD